MKDRTMSYGNRNARRGAGLVSLAMAAALLAIGCAPSPEAESVDPGPPVTEQALERARAAADELGRRLSGELGAQLEAGTPPAAIDVCSRIAPAAAEEISREGLGIRRTSLRVRNSANAADDWERGWLSRFEETVAAGDWPGEVHEVDEAAGELRYLRPIGLNEVCLTCHGRAEELDPEVRQSLAERYPEDRATGFAVGDLRGAFSVRVRFERPGAEPLQG